MEETLGEEEKTSDIDVEQLLASINQNFCVEDEDTETKVQPQAQDNQAQQPINQNNQSQIVVIENQEIKETQSNAPTAGVRMQLTIVREQAEQRQEEVDPILAKAQKIENQGNILTDPDLVEHKLDTHPLQVFVDDARRLFDQNVDRVYSNQRQIVQKIETIRVKSQNLSQIVTYKDREFLSEKLSVKEAKVKEVKALQTDSEKLKTYLILMIQRLEQVEQDLDYMIDRKIKTGTKNNSASQEDKKFVKYE